MGVYLFIGLFDAILIFSGIGCIIGGLMKKENDSLFGTGIICMIFAALFTFALVSLFMRG